MNSNIHAAVHQAVWRRMPLNFFLSTSSSLLPVSATSKCNCAAALPWVKPFVFISVCVCVCCEFMKATSAHVGIQQGHPTPSGKTWPLQQSRHHLQTSHVFFWTRYAYTTIPIYPGQRCVRATGHKQWIIRQRDDVTYPYLVETYIYAHISMTDTDTHTHTYIYICLSLGHLSGYLYLTLQVFKRYIGIALNHQIHMHSNSSKTNKQIYVYILYIYILSMCVYMYIYIYCMLMYLCIWQCLSIISLQVFSKVADRYRQVQTGADYSPLGCSMPLGA